MRLEAGCELEADIVVSNVDLPMAYSKLLHSEAGQKKSDELRGMQQEEYDEIKDFRLEVSHEFREMLSHSLLHSCFAHSLLHSCFAGSRDELESRASAFSVCVCLQLNKKPDFRSTLLLLRPCTVCRSFCQISFSLSEIRSHKRHAKMDRLCRVQS